MSPDTLTTDVLILGGGGAALCAALHAKRRAPGLRVTLVVKALVGKSGCTRMVQGGYNAVLNPADSLERHFEDTIRGGAFLNDQDLVWILVTRAPQMVAELENAYGCFFDRNPDGTIHQKPFGGQSFDRTIHRGDLTGIEIMERLRDAVLAQDIQILEDHRNRRPGILEHPRTADLAGDALSQIRAPTLLIVGGADTGVLELNQEAFAKLNCVKQLHIVPEATHLFEEPGALGEVVRVAGDWFALHLQARRR